MTLTITAPIRTVSGLNAREHWRVRANRVRRERHETAILLLQAVSGKPKPVLPLVVTMTRTSPRMLDCDNLPGAFKAIRDEIASWYQINDNDPRVSWLYRQDKGKLGVIINIEHRGLG